MIEKITFSLILTYSFLIGAFANKERVIPEKVFSFYEMTMPSIDGERIDFSIFAGKKVLIVNVASQCGFTKQYADLQKLYEKYDHKLEILAFPTNDFGSQEPGTNEEIKKFCSEKFQVSFRLFQKISLKGDSIPPLFLWLTNKDQNGMNATAPKWNFYKYLVDENGQLTAVFDSQVNPMSEEILHFLADK